MVAFLLIFGYVIVTDQINKTDQTDQSNRVVFENGLSFSLEYAVTPDERAIGLSNREFLATGTGMLFIFDTEDIYSFWMKDTLIPLDILWINSNMDVVYIKRNALPESYLKNPPDVFTPDANALYVLETNAGELDDIEVGDRVVAIK